MASEDVTLRYVGEYDNAQILTALKEVDDGYSNSAKVAEKAYESIGNADSQAAAIAKTNAAMRQDMQRENSAAALKQAEKDAEQMARIQAKAEAEYERVNSQANAAEAAAQASRINRAVEKEQVYHQTRLQALAGNDAAMEAEERRHVATMSTLQADSALKSEMGMRSILQRVGTMGNQVQGLQMAFFGIGQAADGAESKFGRLIGTTANMASGALGLAQAYEIAKVQIAEMDAALMVGLPVLAAVGIAFAVILDHHKHLAELAKKNDWLGDPAQYAAVTAAINDVDEAQKGLTHTVSASAIGFGMYVGVMDMGTKSMSDYYTATEKLQSITGLTRQELTKLYGDLGKVKEAWETVANDRMINMQFTYERAVIGAKKEGVEKAVELQVVANKQAEEAIKAHFSAVLFDIKKTDVEKKRAAAEMGKELELQEKINQVAIEAVRATYANKAEKKSDSKEAQVVKDYHRMELESARALDKALADLDENKLSRVKGEIDAEWMAVQRLYKEKSTAANVTTLALAELDKWYADQTETLEAKSARAVIENNALLVKDYTDYSKAIMDLDIQIRDSKIQITNDTVALQRQQVLDTEEKANAVANVQREKWYKDSGDRVAADKMANELIAKNHAITTAQMSLISKQAVEKETQMRLGAYSNVLSAGEGFVSAIAGQNKALFAISKAVAAANVAVHGVEAIGQIHASTPPPAWAFLDGLSIAATALQEATIAATVIQGFRDGGYTGDGPEGQVAGQVHRKEVVWSARDVANAGGRDAVEMMRQGGGGGNSNVHFGDTYVQMAPGATVEHAEAVGRKLGAGRREEIMQWVRNRDDAKYLGIKSA